MTESPILPGRACGSCTLCCKLLRIEELDKPAHRWCVHCEQGRGCTIYEERPAACRGFYCGWLTLPMAGEHWFPPRAKMMLFPAADGKSLSVLVDPGRVTAWREEPYFSEIRSWARAVAGREFEVRVVAGGRAWRILADGEVELPTN